VPAGPQHFAPRRAHPSNMGASAAMAQHGKGDHLTGHEQSKLALEYSTKAHEFSQEAHKESAAKAGNAGR
jgi:hypothetical protein